MADSRDITGKNRKFTGTGGIKLPTGSTAQRVDETGQIRFNNETNLAEYYTGTDWKAIDAPPTITQFTVDGGADVTSAFIDASAGGNATIEVKGSLFDTTGANVTFVGTSETLSTASITRNSANLLTVTVARSGFDNSNEPYAIKVTNGSGLSAELAGAINQDAASAFSTAADTTVLSTYEGQSAPFSETTLVATDSDGDTVTHTISAGSLPPGLSLSTAGALTGTVSGSSIQNYTFTVQAATTSQTVTRQFVIAITANPYIEATGGSVTESGDYKIHTFTGDGCFVVSNAGAPAGSTTMDYLVVAGGGGGGGGGGPSGGSGAAGSGGGAGGYREGKQSCGSPHTASPLAATTGITATVTTYPITVGAGGAAGPISANAGNGGNSVFSTITSAGGGRGGKRGGPACEEQGNPGGSGGGSSQTAPTGAGGTGNTPPVSPPQGQSGGFPSGASNGAGSGGGGASTAGSSGIGTSPSASNVGGDGGDGVSSSISGSSVARGGGGGGGAGGDLPIVPNHPGGAGGTGGGGEGEQLNNSGGAAGTANTGGGGGGGSANPGSPGLAGGSGIVIIRYKFQ